MCLCVCVWRERETIPKMPVILMTQKEMKVMMCVPYVCVCVRVCVCFQEVLTLF